MSLIKGIMEMFVAFFIVMTGVTILPSSNLFSLLLVCFSKSQIHY